MRLMYGLEGLTYDWAYPRSGKKAEPMRTPESHPYGYDSYYIIRPKKPWNKDTNDYHSMDSDRMSSWEESRPDTNRYEAAMDTLENGYYDFYSFDQEALDKFLTVFCGKPTKGAGLIANCNISNGYPYFTFLFYPAD